MFKVNNRNTRTKCEISSKLTIKTPEDANRANADWEGFSTEKFEEFVFSSN